MGIGYKHVREVTLDRRHANETPLRFDMIRWAFTRDQLGQLRDQIDRHGWQ